MKSKMMLIFAVFIAFSLFAQTVFADGMVIRRENNVWQTTKENQQLATINYENGFEKMILAVDLKELGGDRAVWLFPIPAEPSETVIDIVQGFPRLYGTDIKKQADDVIGGVALVSAMSQIYPVVGGIFLLTGAFMSASGSMAPGALGYGGYGKDEVIVYEHIEKHGMTTELVTAKDGHSLRYYLLDKAIYLPEEAEAIVNEYIGEDYSFVISWMSNLSQSGQTQPTQPSTDKLSSSYKRFTYSLPTGADNNPKFAVRMTCYDWHEYTSYDACNVDDFKINAGGAELFSDGFANLDAWTGDKSPTQWRASTEGPYSGTTSAGKYGYGGHTITHEQSTAGRSGASISFYAKGRHVYDTGEFLKVEWFDGTIWHGIATLDSKYSYPAYYPSPVSTTNTIGVSVTFPTDKIYFPLKPTSVYGSEQIPILVTVMGHVTPELYPEIQQAQVNYYTQSYYSVPSELEYFFNDKTTIYSLPYTTIKFTTPAKYLKDDLWISNVAPAHVAMSGFVYNNPWLFGIMFFAIASACASVSSGMLIFRNDVSWKKLALWGLWNFLTIIGFAIATIFMKTREVESKLAKQLQDQHVTVWDSRKIPYVIVFSISFLVICVILYLLCTAIF